MLALEKEKDEALEKAKLRIIAENDKELQDWQENLNEAMKKEEEKMEEQLGKRRE